MLHIFIFFICYIYILSTVTCINNAVTFHGNNEIGFMEMRAGNVAGQEIKNFRHGLRFSDLDLNQNLIACPSIYVQRVL